MATIEGLDRMLAGHPFFEDMSERARGLIAGCAANRVFHRGEHLLREGDPADVFYLLRHGSVAIELHAPGRSALVLETLRDGEVIGWSWLVPPYRTQFDARAIGLVRALSINGKCLRDKCAEDSSLGYEFLSRFARLLAERLTATRLQLLDLYGHPSDYAARPAERPLEAPTSPAKPGPSGP